jgi:hypothetical protein
VAYDSQIDALSQGLISVNWDHFPRHESYVSDRLPTSLLAGRVHVTTDHLGLDWLPGPEIGLFREPTVAAVVERVEQLAATPPEDLLALGAAGRSWVKHRLSDREAARYMLGAVDTNMLDGLPTDPWRRWLDV